MDVVVVESPAKAKTINKYLGPGYEVLASFGHVRDLPAKNGSVDPDHDFHMLWEVDPKAQKRLNDIAKAVKGADRLILATDPDHQAVRSRCDEEPARNRCRAGRCLPGAPRARLPRRLHALPGTVAQAAGRALGRTGAVGRAAPGLRP